MIIGGLSYHLVSEQIVREKGRMNLVFFHEFEMLDARYSNVSAAVLQKLMNERVSNQTFNDERIRRVTRHLKKISKKHSMNVHLFGVDFKLNIQVPDTSKGLKCLHAISNPLSSWYYEDFVPSRETGNENSSLTSDYSHIKNLMEKLNANANTELSLQILQLLRFSDHIQVKPFTECPLCDDFPEIKKSSDFFTLRVDAEACDLFEQALNEANQYIKAAPSSTYAMDILEDEFNHRLSLLPQTLRMQIRNAIFNDDGLKVQQENKSIQTMLGTLNVNRNAYYADLDRGEQLIRQFTENANIRPSSQPWGHKYPTVNNCIKDRPWGSPLEYCCSTIEVIAPNDRDYLVVVKNELDEVVDHRFVVKNQTASFKVKNGQRYRTYFITGTSWNPAAAVPCKSCDGLFGYFNNSQITKSESEFLFENVMTYTLTRRVLGNFIPKSSTIDEVL